MPRRTPAVADPWHELFTTQYGRLAGWVRRLVDDDDTAHEIASEAFTRLMSRWSRPDNPLPYLYTVATNLVRDHWRRTRRERQAMQAVMAAQRVDGTGGDKQGPGSSVDLRSLLEPLPQHQRTAVVLHYLAGFSIYDVSKMVGRPEGTVKSDLFQARTRLRKGWMADHE